VFQLTSKPETARDSSDTTLFLLSEGVRKGFFIENRIDTLIHAAYDFRPSSRKDIWNINVKGSIGLFKQASDEGTRCVLFVSTMSAYEGCRSFYGQAKLEIELALQEIGPGFSVRPGLIYSTPLEESGGMVGSILRRVQRGGVVPLIGGGRQELYLTHEKDLARFLEWLLEQPIGELGNPGRERKKYFLTANPKPYAFKRIVELIAKAAKAEISFLPVPWRAVWLGLKGLEAVGIESGFRSDSALSLVYQQKCPDFSMTPRDFIFGDFEEMVRACWPNH
jgi:nucleoside-diphosphate-sugar epimerase